MIDSAEAPGISIIVSLVDHRDEALPCINSLVNDQNASADDFEVIVVSDGSEPDMDQSIRGELRDHDLFLVEPSSNEYRLFNRGAREAKGDVVLVIESHCIAEHDFVSHFLRAFENPEVQALRCTTVGMADGKLKEFERDVFETSFERGLAQTEWNRVLIHGFAMRRSLYEEMDGFREKSENFGPWELGARLHQRGVIIDCLREARVLHRYMGYKEELR